MSISLYVQSRLLFPRVLLAMTHAGKSRFVVMASPGGWSALAGSHSAVWLGSNSLGKELFVP